VTALAHAPGGYPFLPGSRFLNFPMTPKQQALFLTLQERIQKEMNKCDLNFNMFDDDKPHPMLEWVMNDQVFRI
jgi:hypothetical protein